MWETAGGRRTRSRTAVRHGCTLYFPPVEGSLPPRRPRSGAKNDPRRGLPRDRREARISPPPCLKGNRPEWSRSLYPSRFWGRRGGMKGRGDRALAVQPLYAGHSGAQPGHRGGTRGLRPRGSWPLLLPAAGQIQAKTSTPRRGVPARREGAQLVLFVPKENRSIRATPAFTPVLGARGGTRRTAILLSIPVRHERGARTDTTLARPPPHCVRSSPPAAGTGRHSRADGTGATAVPPSR